VVRAVVATSTGRRRVTVDPRRRVSAAAQVADLPFIPPRRPTDSASGAASDVGADWDRKESSHVLAASQQRAAAAAHRITLAAPRRVTAGGRRK